ncbi:double-stranded RNA-binding protein 4-like isoform X2 [Malania oleifera]|uniref:double-stranded RNA-binding protein 4-like isoform X2 n=1 Tax=Malania oleifera TaxID=397392 RepID=UPI0025AE5BAF|nr:double-stranded RNA-binding protein 4-like isoform X2 [Malania oleifera]
MASSSSCADSLKPLAYKNLLQEYTQKLNLPFPIYYTINEGYQHAPEFKSTVFVEGIAYPSSQTFFKLKDAEQSAAKYALECIKKQTKQEESLLLDQDSKFWKSILNEYAVMLRHPKIPTYTVSQMGESRPAFLSSVVFDGKTYTGDVGRSKIEAEQRAARAAIRSLLVQVQVYLQTAKNQGWRTWLHPRHHSHP